MDINQISITDFKANLDKYVGQKSASHLAKIDFKTDVGRETDQDTIDCLEVDRTDSVSRLNKLIKNIDAAISIEAGIFEYSLVYITVKNMPNDLLSMVYLDKLEDILRNLDPGNTVGNTTLIIRIRNNKLNNQLVAFMTPQEIHPKRWKESLRKKEIIEYKKKNMAATDMYKCRKCGKRRCTVTQLQTRGSDEPVTTFITCLTCKNTFKK